MFVFSLKEQIVKSTNTLRSIIKQAFQNNKNVYLIAKYMQIKITNEMFNNKICIKKIKFLEYHLKKDIYFIYSLIIIYL